MFDELYFPSIFQCAHYAKSGNWKEKNWKSVIAHGVVYKPQTEGELNEVQFFIERPGECMERKKEKK